MQPLREIIDRLRSTYCGSISAQFMSIDDLAVREWLQRRMEDTENRLKLSRDEQIRILTRLTDAVIFEEFIRRKYVGRQDLFAGRRREPDSAVGSGHREGRPAGRPARS